MNGIVVGLDCSQASATALRWAVGEARLRDRGLTAVMAWGYPEQYRGMGRFEPQASERAAVAALDDFVAANAGDAGGVSITRRAIDGFAAEAVLDAARDADLLVVGARGRGPFGLRLGSVSEQCLHHAPCPLAIVRQAPPRADDVTPRIVVGYDGSEASCAALRWAFDEGRLRDACVDVVHAWAVPITGAHPFSVAAFDPTRFEEAAEGALDAAIEASDTSGLKAPVVPIVVNGSPARAILDIAKHADLVVVGSRGTGGFAGLLLGSVAHQVAHHATCPVVIHRAA